MYESPVRKTSVISVFEKVGADLVLFNVFKSFALVILLFEGYAMFVFICSVNACFSVFFFSKVIVVWCTVTVGSSK